MSGITRGYYNENKYTIFSMIPTIDDPYYKRWPSMTPLERCAWMWVYKNQKALDRLSEVPEQNKYIVRLEDLNNKKVLKRLEAFLGVKARKRFLKKRVNSNSRTLYPPKEEWTDEMNRKFNEIAGGLMAKFGYVEST